MAQVTGTENVTRVLTVRDLLGDEVVNTAGENLGDIEDFMIDLNTGCIAYAVLEFGGFLGMGEKLFAVPWNSFAVDEDNKQLVLNVDKEALKKAPGFDKDHWPMSNDARCYRTVDQYYRQYGTTGTMGGTMGGGYRGGGTGGY